MDVQGAVVELYGLAPEDFTAARNELAKAILEPGSSAQIRALRRPTLAAWLANQMVRAVPDEIDTLTRLGAELRDAHLSRDGARLRELTPLRHDLVDNLVRTARELAQARDRKLTDGVANRLTETLDAALVDPGAAQLLRSGRLTSALRHVGFGVVDEAGEPAQALAPTPVSSPVRRSAPRPKEPGPDPAEELLHRRQGLQEQVDEAEAEYQLAKAELAQAEAELDANEHHIGDMETAIERLTDELARVRAELKNAKSSTSRLERALTRCARTAAVAAKLRDAARERLDTLSA